LGFFSFTNNYEEKLISREFMIENTELEWDVVQTKAGFRSVVSIAAVMMITGSIISTWDSDVRAQSADVPNWRLENIWQYNVTIADTPGNHRATVLVTKWGEYSDDNNTKFDTFLVSYITNTAFYNDTYGTLDIRDVETRHITRTEYKMTFTEQNTTYYYEHTVENVTEVRITNYNQMIDFFNFPLQVGDKWQQSIIANTTTQIKVKKPTSWEIVSEDVTHDTLVLYSECTGIEDITLTITDNEEALRDSSLPANWTETAVSAFRIVRDDEEQDTDGTYTVDYYNVTRGNIVRKEMWKDGDLNVTWSLVYTDFIYSEEPFKPPAPDDGDDPGVFLCIFGIAILVILIITFFVIRSRSIPKEERFTREYIEAVDTKTELIELCEEAKLSTKGAKSQLRKRLLVYVEELEREEREKKPEEDFGNEVLTADDEELEKDIDELALDEAEGDSESDYEEE